MRPQQIRLALGMAVALAAGAGALWLGARLYSLVVEGQADLLKTSTQEQAVVLGFASAALLAAAGGWLAVQALKEYTSEKHGQNHRDSSGVP